MSSFVEPRGVLVVLMGLPAVGKSTVARGVAAAADDSLRVDVVRFDDDLEARGAVAEAFDAEQWRASRAASLARVRSLLEAAPGDGVDRVVVADDNCEYRSMRRELFVAARDRGWAFAVVHVAGASDVCERRNAARPDRERVPAATITAMAARLEPPDPAVGWERFARTLASGDDPALVLALAAAARAAGAPERPEDPEVAAARLAAARGATARSDAHALDLRLRACVGAVAARAGPGLATKGHRAALGAALAKARKAAGAAADPLAAFRDDALRRLEGAAPPFDAAALARVRAALDAAIT